MSERQRSHRPGQRPRGATGLPPLLAGARVSLPSAYSIRRSFSSLRLRVASVPCAPVRPQARKFALRHAAQALSSRALIGHVRQPGPTQKGSGAAREPTEHTHDGRFLTEIQRQNTTEHGTRAGLASSASRQAVTRKRSFLFYHSRSPHEGTVRRRGVTHTLKRNTRNTRASNEADHEAETSLKNRAVTVKKRTGYHGLLSSVLFSFVNTVYSRPRTRLLGIAAITQVSPPPERARGCFFLFRLFVFFFWFLLGSPSDVTRRRSRVNGFWWKVNTVLWCTTMIIRLYVHSIPWTDRFCQDNLNFFRGFVVLCRDGISPLSRTVRASSCKTVVQNCFKFHLQIEHTLVFRRF